MNNDKYLSVGALTRYLKYKFDVDEHLRTVYLKGEISNLKKHTTGHFYFSIKDENSKISAIMFNRNTKDLSFNPEDGMKVLVKGRVSIYEATGNYQIYVEQMEEDGLGNLYVLFEKLKKDLKQEGLFDDANKKPIPKIPDCVGIVTAPTGAAIKDILSTIKRRYPICKTILFPALVQGENAALDIVNKIKMANHYDIDVLIVGRGGGSIEDLWPFNEECVARAIYESKVPVISAVGHEIDYTIADFVADLRAPTPTGAAEIAVPNMYDLKKLLGQYQIRASEYIVKNLNYKKLKLEKMKDSFILKNPMILFDNKKQYFDTLIEKININIDHIISYQKQKLDQLKMSYIFKRPEMIYDKQKEKLKNDIVKLELINPLKVLKRGYSLTYHENSIISSVKDITKGSQIMIRLANGQIGAQVTSIKEENDGKEG